MKKFTAEQKKKYYAEQKESAEKALIEGVKYCYTEGNFKKYLDVVSRFHDYSINNCMLIAWQNPDATYVAGFSAWRDKFKRNVRKGEKAIKILAPVPKKIIVKDVNPDGTETEREVRFTRFRSVNVFDISQTDGEDLPSICNRLDGKVDDYDDVINKLIALAKPNVRFDDLKGKANGYYSRVTDEIVLQSGMSQKMTIKTLVHEIAHSILHSDAFIEIPRSIKEMQAESVAYMVCKQIGIDTDEYTFEYVASWASGDTKKLSEQMDICRKTSDMIVGKLIPTVA